MRFLRSIHSTKPAIGGPIEGIKQADQELRNRGHETEIVTLDPPHSPWHEDFSLPIHALGPGRTAYGYSGRLVPWLRSCQSRFDAVIVHGIWQYSSFGVWRALRGSESRYFVYPHGMLDPWFKRRYPLKHVKKWFYWPWAEYRVLRDADSVLFTCEEERRLARKSFWLYRCRESVVNYGTKLPEGDPSEQREQFLRRFPELEGRRILLFLGRIHEKKGVDLLIRAFCELCRRNSDWGRENLHLVIAGPCSDHRYLSEVQNLALEYGADTRKRISWVGMVEGAVKWGALRLADVFILPSHQENFGIAVTEALAVGTPVLISDKVNICREVENSGSGYVEDDSESGVARLLLKWRETSSSRRTEMSENAVRLFGEQFEVGRAVDSLLKVIDRKRAIAAD